LLLANDVFDCYPKESQTNTGELRGAFLDLLDLLEKYLKINVNTLPMQTLSNTIYYFCKF
jgi:hypothetical protein